MKRKLHRLKAWPEYFSAVKSGKKTFEVRKNDRDFNAGDIVELNEWNPDSQEYSGRALTFTIGYVLREEFGLQPGYCAFSLLPRE